MRNKPKKKKIRTPKKQTKQKSAAVVCVSHFKRPTSRSARCFLSPGSTFHYSDHTCSHSANQHTYSSSTAINCSLYKPAPQSLFARSSAPALFSGADPACLFVSWSSLVSSKRANLLRLPNICHSKLINHLEAVKLCSTWVSVLSATTKTNRLAAVQSRKRHPTTTTTVPTASTHYRVKTTSEFFR